MEKKDEGVENAAALVKNLEKCSEPPCEEQARSGRKM